MDRHTQDIRWTNRPEQIWITVDGDCMLAGDVKGAYTSVEAAGNHLGRDEVIRRVTLHRPSLAPVYGGPTLLEALWAEMDMLMERLMTGAVAEDGGDRFRAEELAWVIAIVSNPYNPSMDNVRTEAMDRWNAAEAEADAQAEEQQHQWDAAGVNGYEL